MVLKTSSHPAKQERPPHPIRPAATEKVSNEHELFSSFEGARVKKDGRGKNGTAQVPVPAHQKDGFIYFPSFRTTLAGGAGLPTGFRCLLGTIWYGTLSPKSRQISLWL